MNDTFKLIASKSRTTSLFTKSRCEWVLPANFLGWDFESFNKLLPSVGMWLALLVTDCTWQTSATHVHAGWPLPFPRPASINLVYFFKLNLIRPMTHTHTHTQL